MKIIFLLLLLLFYLIYIIIRSYFNIELSDTLSIISITVDIAMPLVIAYYLQNKFLIHRSLKSYHISLCDQILNDYKIFIDQIIKGDFNRREINNKFKSFSISFTFIDSSNQKRFKTNVNLQSHNRSIQTLITNSQEFNTTVTNGKVKLSNSSLSQLYIEYAKLLDANGDLIFVLNK
ncbi:hypothetical protein G4D82_13900 [Flavobacterium sp. CYK-4]|uniref:hypothetical protein n=1 Tax=Flavobacterium lotistagni TaxID=2709660 RepID=UPI00140DCBAA|nr:hypothetical protein [Flavobacterium lotistagni]NHM08317.1 hypothetical protein [Flavobacterium lotistagni]